MRRPRTHGRPPQTSGFTVIRAMALMSVFRYRRLPNPDCILTKQDRRLGSWARVAAMTPISRAIDRSSSSEAKIALFRSLFRGREDVYPRRFESRRTGRSGYEAIGYMVMLPASAIPGWPTDVTLPSEPIWKRDYAASVRRLVRDGVDTPLASLFLHVTQVVAPAAEG